MGNMPSGGGVGGIGSCRVELTADGTAIVALLEGIGETGTLAIDDATLVVLDLPDPTGICGIGGNGGIQGGGIQAGGRGGSGKTGIIS